MIEFKGVSKYYQGVKVLDNIDFTCYKGKIQCLIGRNGVGKSTLVNISSGLLKPEKGTISILGSKVSYNHRDVLKKVGFVLEAPTYINQFSAKEQLEFIGAAYGLNNLNNKVSEILDFFELPNTKKRISQYSTGMKSKVSLASALIHSPEVLILDEPFEGLDIQSYDNLLKYLKNYASKGNTVLITTHQVDVIIEICDNIALMKNDSTLENYSSDKLLEDSQGNFENDKHSSIRQFIMKTISQGE